MGCCSWCNGNTGYQAPLPPSMLARSKTLSGLNTKDFPSRISNNIKKLNNLYSQLEKKVSLAKRSRDDFYNSLDSFVFRFIF